MGGPWTLVNSSYVPVLNGNNGSYTNTDDHFNSSWVGKPVRLPKAVRARMKGANYAVTSRYNCPMGLASLFSNELKKYKFDRYFWIIRTVHKTTTITIYRYVKKWSKKVEVLKLRPKIMEPVCTVPANDVEQHENITAQETPCTNKISFESANYVNPYFHAINGINGEATNKDDVVLGQYDEQAAPSWDDIVTKRVVLAELVSQQSTDFLKQVCRQYVLTRLDNIVHLFCHTNVWEVFNPHDRSQVQDGILLGMPSLCLGVVSPHPYATIFQLDHDYWSIAGAPLIEEYLKGVISAFFYHYSGLVFGLFEILVKTLRYGFSVWVVPALVMHISLGFIIRYDIRVCCHACFNVLVWALGVNSVYFAQMRDILAASTFSNSGQTRNRRGNAGPSRHGQRDRVRNSQSSRRGGRDFGPPREPMMRSDPNSPESTEIGDDNGSVSVSGEYTSDEATTYEHPIFLVIKPKENFAWYKGKWTTYEDGSWTTCDGEVVESTVYHGTFLESYIADPAGTMVHRAGLKGRTALFPFKYVQPGPKFGFCGGWVFLPGEARLREKFAFSIPTEHTRRAGMNRLLMDFPTLPEYCALVTVSYYFLRVALADFVVPAPISRLAPPDELDRVAQATRDMGCNQFILTTVTQKSYAECPLRPPLERGERREVFRIISAKGARLTNGQLIYNTVDDRPPKTFLRAFRFGGAREFVRYCRTAGNQAASMIRPFKCRGGSSQSDDDHTARQLSLIDSVFRFSDKRLAELGGFRRVRGGYEFRKGDWDKFFPNSCTPEMVLIAATYRSILELYLPNPSFGDLTDAFASAFLFLLRAGHDLVHITLLVGLMLCDFMTFRFYYGYFDHAKVRLRKRVGEAFYGADRLTDPVMVREITAEVKDEPAKPGKPPRQYWSLGPESSMFAGAHVALAKKLMSGPRTFYASAMRDWSATVQFVDFNRSTDVGKFLEGAARKFDPCCSTIGYFSDDILSIDDKFLEMDISMSDGAVGYGIFEVLVWFLKGAQIPDEIIYGNLEQLTRNFRMRNPVKRDEFLVGCFLTFYLVSGTTLTTIANNFSSLLVIAVYVSARASGIDDIDELKHWFSYAGYVVTIEERAAFESLTLLKRFPCRTTDGSYAAPLCLGALFKTFGDITTSLDEVCMPGSQGSSLEARCARFLGGVVESWKNEPGHPLLDEFRALFPPMGVVNLPSEMTYKLSEVADTRRLDVDSLCERYNVPRTEYDGCVEFLRSLRGTEIIGGDITSPFMTAVLAVDYGL